MDAALFEQLIDSVGVGIGVYDADGEYIYINPAYAEMLDAETATLVGRPIWELNPAFEEAQFDRYWDSFETGETRTAQTTHEFGRQVVDVQTITTRVEMEGEAYNIGTIQDITLRKRRERQLSQLHDVTSELIQAHSPKEIARITATTAETILGYDRNIVRFATDSGMLSPVAATDEARANSDTDRSYRLDGDSPAARAYRDGEPLLIDDAATIDDEYDRGPAGAIIYLPIGSYAVLSIADDSVAAFDTTDVDLASILASTAETALDRLQNEQDLERQNERLAAFVDVISHDIPNHLNVAETRLQLARDQSAWDHLDHVSQAHDRIESLISDMRMLVDQGTQIESMEWLRFQDQVNICWRSCTDTDTATMDIVDEGFIRADESRFRQLLENLFWNALEHAGDEPTIRAGLLDDGFYIADDGPGIPEAKRATVLSPGFTTAGDSGEHFGFGLAIVNEIVRAHDWEIAITDSDSGGARFEITNADRKSESGG